MQNHRKEIETALKETPDLCISEFVSEIIALVDKFKESGQSGGSAPYYAHAIADTIKKLCLHQPISDLTGQDNEWYCHDDAAPVLWQNNRDGAVFMGKDKRPYYLNAIVFRDENGACFTGIDSVKKQNGETISSSQFFKMPCTPKSFYIDTIDVGDETFIKDESQLEVVFDFYDRPLSD